MGNNAAALLHNLATNEVVIYMSIFLGLRVLMAGRSSTLAETIAKGLCEDAYVKISV